MESFLSRVQEFIDREQLFTRDDRLLVAVSGGMDSCVLTHALHAMGYRIGLAHCNYRLRGEASDADAELVKDTASRYGVRCHSLVAPPPDPLPSAFNVQVWARETRYNYFKKVLDEYSYTMLVTAHHLDDNLETQLLHLLRGTGLSGLRAIPVQSSFPLTRPLLETTRVEISEYARSHRIPWREDASNASDAYARNRIRHHLLPLLRELGLTDRGARSTFRHLRSAERFYVDALQDHPSVKKVGEELVFARSGHGLTREDLLTLLWYHGKLTGFTEDQYRQMLDTYGKAILRSATHIARINPATITFCRQVPDVPEAQVIDGLPYTGRFGPYQLRIDEIDRPENLATVGAHYCRPLEQPLTLRSRAPGDTFAPFGMGGKHKKVKDVLIEQKLAPWEKPLVPLLLDASGEIACVIGHRIGAHFAVRATDRRVIRILFQTTNPGPRQ